MKSFSASIWGLLLGALLVTGTMGTAAAQTPPERRHRGEQVARDVTDGEHAAGKRHAAKPPQHAAKPAPEEAHEKSHAGAEHHELRWEDFNWFYGFLGEKADEPPSVAWRPPGMAPPFGAMLLNAALLYLILFKLLGGPIMSALKERKETLLRGMDEAAKMKRDAKARLKDYEAKLANIDSEVDRVRREMKEAGEIERERILRDAKERRARMEQEATLLIDQELKAAREIVLRETVEKAIRSAEATITRNLTAADHQRLADDYLSSLKSSAAALRGRV